MPNEQPKAEVTIAPKGDNLQDSLKMEVKLDLMLDPEKLRCLNSKEGLTTTITVIT